MNYENKLNSQFTYCFTSIETKAGCINRYINNDDIFLSQVWVRAKPRREMEKGVALTGANSLRKYVTTKSHRKANLKRCLLYTRNEPWRRPRTRKCRVWAPHSSPKILFNLGGFVWINPPFVFHQLGNRDGTAIDQSDLI